MSELDKRVKTPVRDPKHVIKPCFITYRLSCVGEEEDPIDLEISRHFVAASVISENERTTIEQGLSTAMINVMDSIESTQF
jgi:hypothetical protein